MDICIVADIVCGEDGSLIAYALVQPDVVDAAESDPAATLGAQTDSAGRAFIKADVPKRSKWGALDVRADEGRTSRK